MSKLKTTRPTKEATLTMAVCQILLVTQSREVLLKCHESKRENAVIAKALSGKKDLKNQNIKPSDAAALKEIQAELFKKVVHEEHLDEGQIDNLLVGEPYISNGKIYFPFYGKANALLDSLLKRRGYFLEKISMIKNHKKANFKFPGSKTTKVLPVQPSLRSVLSTGNLGKVIGVQTLPKKKASAA